MYLEKMKSKSSCGTSKDNKLSSFGYLEKNAREFRAANPFFTVDKSYEKYDHWYAKRLLSNIWREI